MSDNKKYYYLKLKDNFFDGEEIIILEAMQDGYKYSNILMKLFLRSLKNEGKLMLREHIPYNSNMLAQITRHSIGDIEKAVSIFKELGLIEVLDDGAIFMLDIQLYIGNSSTEADRKRKYRQRVDLDSLKLMEKDMYPKERDKCPDKSPPEKKKDKELKLNIELDIKTIPDWLDKTSWNEWITYRNELEKPLTKTSIKQQIEFLKEHQLQHQKILKQSIKNGWIGLFELKQDKTSKTEKRASAAYDWLANQTTCDTGQELCDA